MKKSKIFLIGTILMISMFVRINIVHAADPVAVTIKNNPGTMKVGDTVQLNAEVYPSNTENKNVTWKSGNTKILTVDSNGKIKAVGEGITQITATTVNNKSTSITITVKNTKGTDSKTVDSGFKITSCPNFLLKGKSGTVKTSGGKNVKWSSDNNNVLAIDNKGNITAKNVGSAKITGTSKSKQVSMVVKVISMEFSEKNIKIPKGNSKQIKVTIDAPLNFNPYDYSLSFSRSSTSFLKAKYSTKPDDQEYVSPKKNLPENDTIVRFTYNVDLFAQSKSGQTDISFFIADKSSSARISQTVQSLESSNNFNIICPQIEYSNDMKTMYITMYDKSSFFRLYYTSVNTGSYATWKPMNNTYKSTDGKSIKIDIPSNASQAKLEVFSNNGNDKRNCYTIPFSTTSYTYDNSIKCPKFTENSKPQGLAPVWKENGINQHSGYSNLKLSYSLEGVDNGSYSKYQYNWYIRNGVDNNNEWINTFKTVNYKSELSLFPIANYNENVQGNLLVIDEYGNIKSCYTDLYDDSIFDKIYKKDDVNYYFEKGIPENRRKQLINMINDIPKGISMSTKIVFYFNTDTWARHKWGGGAWTRGCYVGECNI